VDFQQSNLHRNAGIFVDSSPDKRMPPTYGSRGIESNARKAQGIKRYSTREQGRP